MHDSPKHHRQRSGFIRKLVQRPASLLSLPSTCVPAIPKTIVQFWHDLALLPDDVRECMASWAHWHGHGFSHHVFEAGSAKVFIETWLDERHRDAFEHCYHPAMQADYFRLCFLMVKGGLYVDADDVCVGDGIAALFEDGRLKLQPLCYDIGSDVMVPPEVFLEPSVDASDWTFYFNNNPLCAGPRHPIIAAALARATALLLRAGDVLPEIQSTTGPGNLPRSVFKFGTSVETIDQHLLVLSDWEATAISKWPLSYRNDARNWRNSNQRRFRPTNELVK